MLKKLGKALVVLLLAGALGLAVYAAVAYAVLPGALSLASAVAGLLGGSEPEPEPESESASESETVDAIGPSESPEASEASGTSDPSDSAESSDPASSPSASIVDGLSETLSGLLAGATGGDPDPDATSAADAQAEAFDLLSSAARVFEESVEGLASRRITVADLTAAFDEVLRTPELDYVAGVTYRYRNDASDEASCTVTSFALTYQLSPEQLASYEQDMDAAVDRLLEGVDRSSSEFELVLAAHDALVRSCTFSSDSSAAYTAYGALVEGRASNRGYADALCALLDELGVACVTVQSSETGVPWNMVRVDGSWYHVDVAWDDPSPDGGTEADVSRRYCLVGDATIARDHGAWETDLEAPRDYADALSGTTDEERVAFAKEAWRRAIDEGAERVAGFEVYRVTVAQAVEAVEELQAEEPWYDFALASTRYCVDADDPDDCTVSALVLTYRLDEGQVASYAEDMEAALAEAVLAAGDASSDYERVLAVHDYLVRGCAFDSGESPAQASFTAYGALVLGSAVCQGYSDAFALVMERLGIPCVVVDSEEMSHAWNMVLVDGAWYHVDVTWDDPSPDGGPDAAVSYVFFLRGDEAMTQLGHYGWEAAHEAPEDFWS